MGIPMRKRYIQLTEELTDQDPRIITLLGEIGVFSFKPTKDKHPNQVVNMGICEPSILSAAAGMAAEGLIPFVHTISPFIVERAYEQIKVDLAYQHMGVNLVGIGASYDDGGLGTTHYCPGDVPALKAIPDFQIIVPGTADEMALLMCEQYANGVPKYFRLSTQSNAESREVTFGKATVVKKGTKAAVVAVGPLLDMVMEAVGEEDVSVLYYTTVEPFDQKTLQENCPSGKVLLCEPYYYGALTNDVLGAFPNRDVRIAHVGVPHQFMTTYGSREQIDESVGISVENIRNVLSGLLRE